ncbi:MAG: hypothetical protein VYA84_09155 [Planctomycetota bacterium]|nr:hypothetical protein [Planctomycetota bacterium]
MHGYYQNLRLALQALPDWIPRYLNARCSGDKVHVLFCMTDHFEAGNGRVSPAVEQERMDRLTNEYPRMADQHHDSAGNKPKRTWFFPPHYHRRGNLRQLVQLCQEGYGEIELHLHHGKTHPDTEENLEKTIRQCLHEYALFGIFGSESGRKKYGFIHGDWALSNSRKDGRFCGVDNEIDVLIRTGCYADFTLPTDGFECNPASINTVFYAKSDPTKRVPYRKGVPVEAGKRAPNQQLMIVQGPIHPYFKTRSLPGFRIFRDAINAGMPASPSRMDWLVKTGIHVLGKPEWVIVKVSMHGAPDADWVLGENMSLGFRHLESKFNTKQSRLHYVTARELYNIIKAAEAGESGDPEQHRNYQVTAPKYSSSPQIDEASSALQALVAKTYCG